MSRNPFDPAPKPKKQPEPAAKVDAPATPSPVAVPVVQPPTTTTAVTVTTSTTPASAAVPWWQSLKFRAYMGGWLTLVIGWLVENLTTHQFKMSAWTWIAITVSTLLTVRSVIADWMNPNVVAPFAVMNRKNAQDPGP